MKHFQGLVYRRATDARNRGDLFLGDRNDSGRVLMLIHGGGWQALSRASIRGMAMEVARECGVTVWTPDYRLLRHSPWPACLDDVEAAARWVLHCRDLPLPPPPQRRLAVGGFSAGAHLALMLGLTRLREATECLIAGAPVTVMGTGLQSHAKDLFTAAFGRRFFGRDPQPCDWREASPLVQTDGLPLPPLQLVHSVNDFLVPVCHSRAMAIRYRRQGGLCRECLFNGRPPNHDIASGRGSGAPVERCLRPEVIRAIHAFLSDCFQ